MKKLVAVVGVFWAAVCAADVRLPEYGQVGAVSNEVLLVSAKVSTVDAKVSALTPSTSYPGTCRVTFVLGGTLPTGEIAERMLENAAIRVKIGSSIVRYRLTSLASGTIVSTVISVTGSIGMYIDLELSDTFTSEQYLYTRTYKTLVEGGNYTIPITLRKADRELFAIGRAQKIDDVSTMQSFLITRDCATTNNYNPITLFGYYHNNGTTTTWVNETGVTDSHPLIENGTITGMQGDFETRIFPWCNAEKRTVSLNYTATQGSSNFYFTWIPQYYWKLEDVTLPFRTFDETTGVWTTNNVSCRVHWISKSPLPGFSLPPWAYIHAYENGAWTTKGVKDGYYYARYDSVTKDNKIQSAPFPTKNTGYTRQNTTQLCRSLNNLTSTVTGPTANNIVYAADNSNRLWAAPAYENYAPFRELAYIQFGASMKSVFYGGVYSNLDSLETAFETAGDSVKSFAVGTNSNANFAWLYIWNPFFGSEGAVMCDASYVARKDENGNTFGEWYVCPDRAADIGGMTTLDQLLGAGAFKLAYTYNTTGKTNRESSRCIDETSLQSMIYWFPGTTTDKCCVRVTDESGWCGGPPSATGANVYGNWLSLNRGDAPQLGLWYVYAHIAPSHVAAPNWGSRPSFAPWIAEGEARSDE